MALTVKYWPAETGDHIVVARRFLQRAIEVEHATIPAYLTALYSLVPGRNDEIAAILRTIVTEEMVHMVLAANILSAFGGNPCFTNEHFIPKYPNRLPYDIGGHEFEVPLAPFSLDLVRTVFLKLEEPEFEPHTGHTVGDLYAVARQKLKAAEGEFKRDRPQLKMPYGAFLIEKPDDAYDAIDAIVLQGEGSQQSPLSGQPGELAHYWRFKEILEGKTLIGDPNSPPSYFSFSGLPIPFDPTGVIPIVSNAEPSMYPPGSQADRVSAQFDELYRTMLHLLERVYLGNDSNLANITGLMFDMKIIAQRLMTIQIPATTSYGPTTFAAPTFSVPRGR